MSTSSLVVTAHAGVDWALVRFHHARLILCVCTLSARWCLACLCTVCSAWLYILRARSAGLVCLSLLYALQHRCGQVIHHLLWILNGWLLIGLCIVPMKRALSRPVHLVRCVCTLVCRRVCRQPSLSTLCVGWSPAWRSFWRLLPCIGLLCVLFSPLSRRRLFGLWQIRVLEHNFCAFCRLFDLSVGCSLCTVRRCVDSPVRGA